MPHIYRANPQSLLTLPEKLSPLMEVNWFEFRRRRLFCPIAKGDFSKHSHFKSMNCTNIVLKWNKSHFRPFPLSAHYRLVTEGTFPSNVTLHTDIYNSLGFVQVHQFRKCLRKDVADVITLKRKIKGILPQQKKFYRLNLKFWIVMECGKAHFDWEGQKKRF